MTARTIGFLPLNRINMAPTRCARVFVIFRQLLVWKLLKFHRITVELTSLHDLSLDISL